MPEIPPLNFFEALTIASFLATLMFGLLAIPSVSARIWHREARLSFQFYSDRLVDLRLQPFVDSIRVRRGRKNVNRLTLTTLVMWNSGKDPIRSTDLDSQNPLRFQFDCDSEIVHSAIIGRSRDDFIVDLVVNASSPNELVCRMPYLNPDDGFAADIWHTGSIKMPRPRGSIQGPKKLFDDRGAFRPPRLLRTEITWSIAIGLYSLSGFFVFLVDIDNVQFKGGFPPEVGRFLLTALTLLLMSPMAVLPVIESRRESREPPSNLDRAIKFGSAGSFYRILR